MGASADGFDWSVGNFAKRQKHGLSVAEIEYVVAHTETLIVHDIKNSAIEQRFIAIGRTSSGRYAVVAFTPRIRDGRNRLRPISARFMHEREIARYEKENSAFQNR
jgi:hypothetical protein